MASKRQLSSVYICSGSVGQALGIEMADFSLNRHHVRGEWYKEDDLVEKVLKKSPGSCSQSKQLVLYAE